MQEYDLEDEGEGTAAVALPIAALQEITLEDAGAVGIIPPPVGGMIAPPVQAPSAAQYTSWQRLEEKRQTDLPRILAMLDQLKDENLSIPKRVEIGARISASIMPLLLDEGLVIDPNPDRSTVLKAALNALQLTTSQLKLKREIEQSDELNPRSPKFQAVFGWFFQMVHDAMTEQETDPILVNNIFDTLGTALMGWEDKIEKRLKGVAGKNVEGLTSPFVKEFVTSTQSGQSPAED